MPVADAMTMSEEVVFEVSEVGAVAAGEATVVVEPEESAVPPAGAAGAAEGTATMATAVSVVAVLAALALLAAVEGVSAIADGAAGAAVLVPSNEICVLGAEPPPPHAASVRQKSRGDMLVVRVGMMDYRSG